VLLLKIHKLTFNDMVLNCWMLPPLSNKPVPLVLLKTSHLLLELLPLLRSEALVFLSVELNSVVLSVEILVVHQAHSQAASKAHQLVELLVSKAVSPLVVTLDSVAHQATNSHHQAALVVLVSVVMPASAVTLLLLVVLAEASVHHHTNHQVGHQLVVLLVVLILLLVHSTLLMPTKMVVSMHLNSNNSFKEVYKAIETTSLLPSYPILF